MHRAGDDMSSQAACIECGGQGYVARACHRCEGSGYDPFFRCMSVPCVECGGARRLFYLCSHVLEYATDPTPAA